jgi:hypothetical protein
LHYRARTMSLNSSIRLAMLLTVVCALLFTVGCSFIASSESSSDILSSPFKSSARSSGGEEEVAFQEETEAYTVAYVTAGSVDNAGFQRGLSDIAARRGISDWENNPETWTSVGRGLGRSQLSDVAVTDTVESLSAGDETLVTLVMQGYSATR